MGIFIQKLLIQKRGVFLVCKVHKGFIGNEMDPSFPGPLYQPQHIRLWDIIAGRIVRVYQRQTTDVLIFKEGGKLICGIGKVIIVRIISLGFVRVIPVGIFLKGRPNYTQPSLGLLDQGFDQLCGPVAHQNLILAESEIPGRQKGIYIHS